MVHLQKPEVSEISNNGVDSQMQIVKGVDVYGGIENEPNIYVIDGEMVVDPGTGLTFADLKRQIENRYETYKIKTIVNTHCHFDHTGGNKKFRDWLKAAIAAHEDDKPFIETGSQTMAEMFGEVPKICTIDNVLKEGDTLRTSNFTFTVIHTPGHTPGSICLYEPNKRILISGDTIFENGIGRFDLPGGNKDQLVASLEKLLNYNIQYLFPGHGPPKIGGVTFLIKQMLAHFGKKQFMNYEFY